MQKTIAIVGALDTKGEEFAFVKAAIEARGHQIVVFNTGVVGKPTFVPDVSAEAIAEAGGSTLKQLRLDRDRGQAISVMIRGVAFLVRQHFDRGLIDGVLGMGGSAGTVIGTAAMRELPVGVPKVMVSTLASADTSPYVGTKDIVMLHSVVDVAGLNTISQRIFANAVGAIVGMVETVPPVVTSKKTIAASMFGNTTELVDQCRAMLEKADYEVLVFHATGTGGRTMESLIADGHINGLLDLTTTEWVDELVGGMLGAGTTRMDAAAQAGIPQVIAPGCVDMVNFWARNTVPDRFADRQFYEWNPNVTLMRTSVTESAEIGRILAEKANASSAPTAIFLPLQGMSVLDSPCGEFWNPEANRALFDAIHKTVRAGIEVVELDCNINDTLFAQTATDKLLEFLCPS